MIVCELYWLIVYGDGNNGKRDNNSDGGVDGEEMYKESIKPVN